MIPEIQNFGSRLRSERERLGISLETIARQTKIKKTYLVGLENGDFSQWPAGQVFRRAYVRDYAVAIGMLPAPVVADFIRLFPDGERAAGAAGAATEPARLAMAPREHAPLAITFDKQSSWYAKVARQRVVAAAIDVALLLSIGALLALVAGSGFWSTAGVLALLYFPTTNVWLGRSVASWYLETRVPQRGATRAAVAAKITGVKATTVKVQTMNDAQTVEPPMRLADQPLDETDDLLDSVVLVRGNAQAGRAGQEAAPIH